PEPDHPPAKLLLHRRLLVGHGDVAPQRFEELEVLGSRLASGVDHLDHPDVPGPGAQGCAENGARRDVGDLIHAVVTGRVLRRIRDRQCFVVGQHPAGDAEMCGKADLQQAGGGGPVRLALARHSEVELPSRGVEQQHGGALGIEELSRSAGRVAQQLVEVREGREAARDLVEEMQAVVLTAPRPSAPYPSVGWQRNATSAAEGSDRAKPPLALTLLYCICGRVRGPYGRGATDGPRGSRRRWRLRGAGAR